MPAPGASGELGPAREGFDPEDPGPRTVDEGLDPADRGSTAADPGSRMVDEGFDPVNSRSWGGGGGLEDESC
jgi:hypothetical protein